MRYFWVTNFEHFPDDVSKWTIEEVQEHEAGDIGYSGSGFVHEVEDVTFDALTVAHGVKRITEEGDEAGDRCGQFLKYSNTLCPGILEEKDIEGGCSCHTGHAPCGYCTAGRLYCEVCGWEQEDA